MQVRSGVSKYTIHATTDVIRIARTAGSQPAHIGLAGSQSAPAQGLDEPPVDEQERMVLLVILHLHHSLDCHVLCELFHIDC